ncbi:MAG TPA: nif-specific transcriptional activator NifA [Anaerohalosphaeraceae bacterium]|nr:nif-specific transcriptional activator NifA [Anaerohalosphaeraceae bacterium]HOL31169.1 nif-specific transcriptional activator NifA [Anaerohalosphaeraceae bacterium]HOM75946.1 nif-specific transcriptional activator NifA [Anaerohalosphaeraceae bacterium]HPC63496.1 nif-specific transcriptional activator NifA [Anaerohalosphaeraceae bacterium]HPO69942.1 nif-specific transcriptional activator NifA [Anaerohalosphaeraceae bacterium]
MAKSLAKEVVLLADIAKAFAESLNLEATLESILKALESHLELERGAITLLDPETETIGIKVAHGLSDASKKQITYKVGEGITGLVVQTGKEVVVPDISKDPRFLAKTGQRPRSKGQKIAFFCVPIKLEGRAIGAISVDRKVRPADDFDAHVRLLEVIATMVAQAVKLNKLVESDRRELKDENERLLRELKTRFNIHNMVGTSGAMQEVYRLIEQVANSNATVLIRGESGTGKDLVAHAIHYNSYRSAKPFIKVNCTALPENLLESELFGHEKGAFTGAVERKPGRFELAEGGTLFLDEIGDFSLHLQVKLLRVIQFKEYERVGGYETLKANVRIIVATNKNLEEEIKNGLFREDLYYRINVFPIYMPPLRERKNDVMLLADYFLEKYARENHKNITRISTPAIEMLTSYHWPGNVRELENCIERAVLLCNEDVIRSEHLPPSLQIAKKTVETGTYTLPEKIEYLEREMIVDALKKTQGCQRHAACELGITERMLGYKIRKYNILWK